MTKLFADLRPLASGPCSTLLAAALVLSTAAAAVAGRQFAGIQTHGRVAKTGFEDLNGDGTDATGFAVGSATFSGGVAGTRNFPPGYHRGHFAFITAIGGGTQATSRIQFSSRRNRVSFYAKDIVELIPATRGWLLVQYQGGRCQRVRLTNRFRKYQFKDVAEIRVVTNGVSNLDTFTVVSLP